jgi:hypothetical protein
MFKKFMANFVEKESVQLGLVIFILTILLLTTGVEAITAGNYMRAIFDFGVVLISQYDFWTKWRYKVDM